MNKLEGIHHVTAITGDAPQNVSFYVGVLGLRMVKKTVNQDDPTVYHLFYGDDEGSPGADLTFFEYPGAAPGRAGAGMVHRVVWRVSSEQALDFWRERLARTGWTPSRATAASCSPTPRASSTSCASRAPTTSCSVRAPDIPSEHALGGFDGVRAYASDPAASEPLLGETLGFVEQAEGRWEVRGERRGSFYVYDPAPEHAPIQGAGTVHHVAFAADPQDEEAWREHVAATGGHPTPVIDRFYFRSVYFREPSGVLFEIATIGPGFAVDEDAAHLGEHLSLPPRFEPLRARLEETLTPLPSTSRA